MRLTLSILVPMLNIGKWQLQLIEPHPITSIFYSSRKARPRLIISLNFPCPVPLLACPPIYFSKLVNVSHFWVGVMLTGEERRERGSVQRPVADDSIALLPQHPVYGVQVLSHLIVK